MRVLVWLSAGILTISAKGIKQQMVENRLKFDRDVIAHGSNDDDYEYDYDDWDPWLDLDDEEIYAKLRKLHHHMDVDKDGFVNEAEIVVWCLVAIFNINGHDAAEDWEVVDRESGDQKSELTWHDITDELYAIRMETTDEDFDPDTFDVTSEDGSMLDYNRNYNRDYARFTAADINGNGLLDKTEWILFNNPLKDEAVKTAAIHEALGLVDTNKDGKVSLDEYLNDWHQKPSEEIIKNLKDIKVKTYMFTDYMDQDKDGFLQEDELIFWLSPENTDAAWEEAEHLMAMSDTDDDELISADELVEETDLWIDNVLTEHGQVLRHIDEL